MPEMSIHYPLAGWIVYWGAIAFLKFFDFLAEQSVKRLLEMNGHHRAG